MPALEVVVARWHERVEWTRNLPRDVRVTIYDKGGDLDPAAVHRAAIHRLPNVGREAHTYLTHIVRRAGDLAPITVFCQGHPFDHAWDLHPLLRALATGREAVDGFRWIGHLVDTDDARGRRLFVRWSKNAEGRELAVDEFHLRLFGEPSPEAIHFYAGGQFAATREAILARPAGFWERALGLSESFPDAAHCFERLWDRVFGVAGVDPGLLRDGPCRWLKPVRRLRGESGGEAGS